MPIQTRLIIWTGDKHSGKTTTAAKLVQTVREQGFNVAGVLAPSVYRDGVLFGFDVCDLRTNERAALARRKKNTDGKMSPFVFLSDGLELGRAALSLNAVGSADLVIIDEFGPLELNGLLWRKNVDSLLASSSALILLVVRQELTDAVRLVYADFPYLEFGAIKPDSIDKVIGMLRDRCQLQRKKHD